MKGAHSVRFSNPVCTPSNWVWTAFRNCDSTVAWNNARMGNYSQCVFQCSAVPSFWRFCVDIVPTSPNPRVSSKKKTLIVSRDTLSKDGLASLSQVV